MKIGLDFRNELTGIPGGFWIVQQFDRMIASIGGIWQRQHLDNGRHGDVTATSIEVAGQMRVPASGAVQIQVLEAEVSARTLGGDTGAIATATPTTIFSLTPLESSGLWIVVACLPNAGAANYTASADVLCDGTNARITANNGALLTITLSGADVQVTQSSGTSTSVQWSCLRVR